MESLQEICQYLNSDTRLDVKAIALEHVLSVTGTSEGRELLLKLPDLLLQLIALTQDSSVAISNDAAMALINITADEAGSNAFLLISEAQPNNGKYNYNLIHVCIRFIMDKESVLADPCCMILSNITRPLHLVDRVVILIEKSGYTWDSIVAAFTAKQYNNTGAKLHYLGPVFSNLSQSPHVRRYLMDRDRSVIQRLLPFTEYTDSLIRRGGIVGTLKNCCFDVEDHEWLLSPEVDILSCLLLPLAGPEEFDDEDNDKLPISLQYLPETKQREPDLDIRIILLEALAQLCATKKGREILREKNTYVILREYHKWEKNKNALLACENVVDILIRTEEEIGLDNLKNVEVPSEYTEKFHKMDQDFINST
ncbi:FAM203 family protein [Habropoda laboriosa]|uniref:Protein HGH1 homolog n=1 Tax=Habropoda laboriosa TaxID=597456 RepID=A0A0L7R346_9HYME|nr:PREDICTED: protein HGH1 homolog [Habropoda laboriosa]KOC65244.1 FAM203 family protein [Habropoda laboriosa]